LKLKRPEGQKEEGMEIFLGNTVFGLFLCAAAFMWFFVPALLIISAGVMYSWHGSVFGIKKLFAFFFLVFVGVFVGGLLGLFGGETVGAIFGSIVGMAFGCLSGGVAQLIGKIIGSKYVDDTTGEFLVKASAVGLASQFAGLFVGQIVDKTPGVLTITGKATMVSTYKSIVYYCAFLLAAMLLSLVAAKVARPIWKFFVGKIVRPISAFFCLIGMFIKQFRREWAEDEDRDW